MFTLFDGEVELSNPQGALRIVSGEQATVDPGQAPVKSPLLVPQHDLIQWCLYYPGVLDAEELNLTPAEEAELQHSLAAYRSGELLHALALMPAGYQPASDSARVYLAAVLLSVGKVDGAMQWLDAIPPDAAENSDKPPAPRLAGALRRLILVVKNPLKLDGLGAEPRIPHAPRCASLNRMSTKPRLTSPPLGVPLAKPRPIPPSFTFAWARVAELEFSFGRRRAARAALDRSLELAPRNAQATALAAASSRWNIASLPRSMPSIKPSPSTARSATRGWAGDCAASAAANSTPDANICKWPHSWSRSAPSSAATLARHGTHSASNARPRTNCASPKRTTQVTQRVTWNEALLRQEGNRINEAITALERSQDLNDNRRDIARACCLIRMPQCAARTLPRFTATPA